uniref:Uncharacterized protein n=1 Tax=Arundo donax TaxID=35708 RepID=A0A0A9G301_ARUDO
MAKRQDEQNAATGLLFSAQSIHQIWKTTHYQI